METRRSAKDNASKVEPNFEQNDVIQRIFILNENLFERGNVTSIRLRHPGTEEPVYFVLDSKEKCIYEVLQFQEPYRSWLINQSVSSCGKCYITVPFNKMFFIIYYLRRNCIQNAVPINQIKDDECPLPPDFIDDYFDVDLLNLIADKKGPADLLAYKYNKDKVLAWLAIQVKRLANKFKVDGVHVGTGAVSANYVKSEKIRAEVDEIEYLKYACGVIGNYITSELNDELFDYFNIKDDINVKRKSLQKFEAPEIKKMKLEDDNVKFEHEDEIKIEAKEKEKEKKSNAKEKALAKAATGTKSIMSFFKK